MTHRASHAVPKGFAQADGHVLIEIRLARLAQLFHSLDPAPFREKDLDPAADAYLVESAEEIGIELPIALVFELPATEIPAARALLPEALRNYFTARALSTRRALNRLLREGRAALVIGLVFLGLCLIASQAVSQWAPGLATRLLGEGLLIVDDLVDTGVTARIVRAMLPKAHFATVYAKPAGRPLVHTFVTDVALPAGLQSICTSRGITVIEAMPSKSADVA